MPHSSPFGARGSRPVFFAIQLPWTVIRELTSIPGVARAPGGLACTWDVAPMLAAYLGVSCPKPPTEDNLTEEELKTEIAALPGLERYRRLELPAKLRSYQKEGALFLARRSYAMNCDPMRSGKSIQGLAASVLINANRTIIVCPAIAKYVWAEEVAKWIKEEALILEGRAGDFAKRYCRTCDARGQVNGERCSACKMRNGQSNGYKVFDTYVWEWDANGKLVCECPKHPDTPPSWNARGLTEICVLCLDELHDAIESAKFVICNFDILVAQKNSDATGKLFVQENLQGWAPVLASHKFDLAILDECHLIRGFSTNQARKGQTRRERTCEVTENIPTVWGLTGTPIFGFVRDLWGQLDCISKGALTGSGDRLPFTFHAYWAEGHKDDYGWKADGRSPKCDTELKERLSMFKIQRPRSMILSQMPPKSRQVVRIDAGDVGSKKPRGTNDEVRLASLLKKTVDAKVDTVTENVISELGEGSKCVVFVYLRESAVKMGKAVEAACKKHDVKARMREVDTKIWTVHGDTSPQARFEMARAFREHPKAGVFIATIDSVQVAVSLKGASSVHFADLHWQPAALLQAEDRPYEVGTTGLSIIYYIVRGSVDEHIEAIVLPKVRTLAEVVNEKGADELRAALAHGVGKENLAQIIKAMMKDVDTDLGAYDDEAE
jgi:SNF2 family DNA or RNA helicase